MENLVKIAEGVLTSCLAVKPGEEILVITDDSRKEIGEAIYEAAATGKYRHRYISDAGRYGEEAC